MIYHSAHQLLFGAKAIHLLFGQRNSQRAAGRIDLGNELRLTARRGDQYPKQQPGIERFDFEGSVSTRPGALAAIRVAGGSDGPEAHLRTGRVDKDGRSL